MKNILFALPLVLGFNAFAEDAPTYSFEKLSDVRAKLALSELSKEEKKLIVDQARMVLKDIFVHRDLKIQNFGPSADPIPALDEIKNRIPDLTTIEFHEHMIRAFHRLNDWHTTYQFPKPYQCYRSLLPSGFKAVKDEFGKEVIGVDSVITKPEFVKLLPPDVKIEAGDILVSYDGLSAAEALALNIPNSYGANPAAIKRDTVTALGMISHKYNFLPKNDFVTLTLKDKSGNLKTMRIPWIVKSLDTCVNPPAEESGEKAAKDFQNEFNALHRKAKKKFHFKAPGDLIDSKEPILRYKMINNEYGSFGYIRLDSFVPEELTTTQTVLEIKRILEGPLLKAEGLIVDLRSNGGGQIYLGEAMVQLLNPKNTVPLNFALKNSGPNRHFWNTTDPTSPFTLELKKAEAESRAITTPIPLNSPSSLNSLGQSIVKPIAVFINASCYSTCDMFSASMQDLGAGIIVGEDPNTGAGGANNWQHSLFTTELPENAQGPFKKLPGGVAIGFSYRQTTRTGLHAGEVIEDVGVKADMIVEATTDDLDTSEVQLRTITRKLAEEAGKFTSSVEMKVPSPDIKLGSRPSVYMKWENTTSIDIRENGLNKGSIEIEPFSEGREIVIPEFVSTVTTENKSLELIGRADGKRVWRKIVNIRTVPESITLSAAQPLSLDFNESMKPLVVYNKNSPAEKGWKVKDGALKISEAGNYASNLSSAATLFAKNKDATTLKFTASIDSEQDYDFFDVYIVVNGVPSENLVSISGSIAAKEYSVDLTPYKGKDIEIRFAFNSDGNKEGTGPVIESLEIK
ncbi:MAG: S41 family peptidase [Bdellovibrionota bacterium]